MLLILIASHPIYQPSFLSWDLFTCIFKLHISLPSFVVRWPEFNAFTPIWCVVSSLLRHLTFKWSPLILSPHRLMMICYLSRNCLSSAWRRLGYRTFLPIPQYNPIWLILTLGTWNRLSHSPALALNTKLLGCYEYTTFGVELRISPSYRYSDTCSWTRRLNLYNLAW